MVRRLQNYRSLNIIPTKNSPIPLERFYAAQILVLEETPLIL